MPQRIRLFLITWLYTENFNSLVANKQYLVTVFFKCLHSVQLNKMNISLTQWCFEPAECRGTCKVRIQIETIQNETKYIETKWNTQRQNQNLPGAGVIKWRTLSIFHCVSTQTHYNWSVISKITTLIYVYKWIKWLHIFQLTLISYVWTI